jgi:hypothetical protein
MRRVNPLPPLAGRFLEFFLTFQTPHSPCTLLDFPNRYLSIQKMISGKDLTFHALQRLKYLQAFYTNPLQSQQTKPKL